MQKHLDIQITFRMFKQTWNIFENYLLWTWMDGYKDKNDICQSV